MREVFYRCTVPIHLYVPPTCLAGIPNLWANKEKINGVYQGRKEGGGE